MRLLPIIAAASIGLFAITTANAQSTSPTKHGAGNPAGAQNMDTVQKGNPDRPSAGQTSTNGMGKTMHHKMKKHHNAKKM